MNKKIISALIIILVFLMVFIACTDMDPFGIANGVPEGFDPEGVTGITLDVTTISLEVDGTQTLAATVTPEDIGILVSWKSSDVEVATVSSAGLVTAFALGDTVITATAGEFTAECTVDVGIPVSGITLNESSTDILVGNTETLIATVAPDNTTDPGVAWLSDDENIATVIDGVVTGVGVGTTTITASAGNFSAECTVNIKYDNDWIYYVEASNIKKMRLDGTGAVLVFTDPDGGMWSPVKIQLDPERRKIYIWFYDISDAIGSRIVEYNLEGTTRTIIFEDDMNNIFDMTIDHVNGYLYYIMSGGISKINLKDTLQIDLIYNVAFADPSYVTPDYKGGVYYYYSSEFYRVDTITTSTPFAVTTAPAADFGGLCYNTSNDSLYYFTSSSILAKLPVMSTMVDLTLDTLGSIKSNIVIYQPENKIFFYDDNGGAGDYIIYNIKIDGSGAKQVILNNGSTYINSFDILAK